MKTQLIRLSSILCLACALPACKPSDSSPAPATKPAPIAAYDMRGIIERLGPASSPRRLLIRHEASRDMHAMAMLFTLDESIPLAGLAVGDKISFHYEMNLDTHAERITKLEKLPADTALNLQ